MAKPGGNNILQELVSLKKRDKEQAVVVAVVLLYSCLHNIQRQGHHDAGK